MSGKRREPSVVDVTQHLLHMQREAEQTQHYTSVAAPVFLCDLLIHTQPLTSRLEIPSQLFLHNHPFAIYLDVLSIALSCRIPCA